MIKWTYNLLLLLETISVEVLSMNGFGECDYKVLSKVITVASAIPSFEEVS